MKLSSVFAKLTSGKAKVLGLVAGLALGGAALTAGAPAANAQVAFGVTVGPRYYAPRPVYRPYGYGYVAPAAPAYGYGYGYAPGYWAHRRYEDWRAHEYWAHRDWRYNHPYGYGWR